MDARICAAPPPSFHHHFQPHPPPPPPPPLLLLQQQQQQVKLPLFHHHLPPPPLNLVCLRPTTPILPLFPVMQQQRHPQPLLLMMIPKNGAFIPLPSSSSSSSTPASVPSSLINQEIAFVHSLASEEKAGLPLLHHQHQHHPFQQQRFLVDGKYEIIKYIASGAYGNVFQARNIFSNQFCALKVIKNRYLSNACVLREKSVLSFLNHLDPSGQQAIVRMFGSFTYHDHLFLTYELLGPSLDTVLKNNQNSSSSSSGLPMHHLLTITVQVLSAVRFLHANHIVHHDIKPENLVLSSNYNNYDNNNRSHLLRQQQQQHPPCSQLRLRLIDFGSALHVMEGNKNWSIPTTRQYRSPEVGLAFGWGTSSDMWSLGCTLFELGTGAILFPCDSEEEKCFVIEHVLEQVFPRQMGKNAGLNCFDDLGRLRYESTYLHMYFSKVRDLRTFKDLAYGESSARLYSFFQLVEEMLHIWPQKRITADAAYRWVLQGLSPKSSSSS